MKLVVFSDMHLGFGKVSQREKESFGNAKQAIELALQQNPDAILVPGDIFEHSIPSQETLHSALKLFSLFKQKRNELIVSKVDRQQNKSKLNLDCLPVIAIHGTHEFRGKDYKNSVQVLEAAGCLIYLHAGHVLLEKGNEKIAVHGLGGVPEKKALDVLRQWNPKPVQKAKNYLLLHQSFKEFLPFDDEMIATLSMDNLPKGFDLIINGHLHWFNDSMAVKEKFLLCGSTIITQMKQLEAGKEKGVTVIDTESNTMEFLPLPKQRRLFYHKIEFNNASKKEIESKLKELIEKDLNEKNSMPPLIRFKLVGELAKGLTHADIDLNDLLNEFKEKAVFSVSKEFKSVSFKKKIQELRELQKSRQSIASIGLNILEKNLNETDFKEAFDVQRIFSLLENNETDKAMELILKKKN